MNKIAKQLIETKINLNKITAEKDEATKDLKAALKAKELDYKPYITALTNEEKILKEEFLNFYNSQENPEKTAKLESGSITVKESLDCEILDTSLIPDDFLIVTVYLDKEAALQQAKKGETIPGVSFFLKKTVAVSVNK